MKLERGIIGNGRVLGAVGSVGTMARSRPSGAEFSIRVFTPIPGTEITKSSFRVPPTAKSGRDFMNLPSFNPEAPKPSVEEPVQKFKFENTVSFPMAIPLEKETSVAPENSVNVAPSANVSRGERRTTSHPVRRIGEIEKERKIFASFQDKDLEVLEKTVQAKRANEASKLESTKPTVFESKAKITDLTNPQTESGIKICQPDPRFAPAKIEKASQQKVATTSTLPQTRLEHGAKLSIKAAIRPAEAAVNISVKPADSLYAKSNEVVIFQASKKSRKAVDSEKEQEVRFAVDEQVNVARLKLINGIITQVIEENMKTGTIATWAQVIAELPEDLSDELLSQLAKQYGKKSDGSWDTLVETFSQGGSIGKEPQKAVIRAIAESPAVQLGEDNTATKNDAARVLQSKSLSEYISQESKKAA